MYLDSGVGPGTRADTSRPSRQPMQPAPGAGVLVLLIMDSVEPHLSAIKCPRGAAPFPSVKGCRTL